MKKIFKLAAIALAATALASCESFLDTENYTEANTANYPASSADLTKEIAALYGVLNQFCNDPLQTYFMVNNLMSDECNGAGGTGDVECSAIAYLMTNKEDLFDKAWKNTYVGIARANSIIYSIDSFDWTGQESTRNQLLGEAYFLRGLFYMWGSQFWGDIPAYWASAAPSPCPQQSAEDVIWPHILADFYSAYNLMDYNGTTQGDGHATKGAAAGYLARAYMFYEGFYKKAGELASASLEDIELPSQEKAEGKLSKANVVSALEDAIGSGKYSLVEDFRLLWQYTNEVTAPDYDYVKDLADAGKYWAGNGNIEEMFQIQYSNCASWNGTIGMGFINQTSLYCGLRSGSDADSYTNGLAQAFPFGQGWGQGVMTTPTWENWPNTDPRKKASILDAEAELEKFGYVTDCSEETGLYNKKIIPVTFKDANWDAYTGAGPYTWWGKQRSEEGATQNNGNCMQGEHYGDIMLLRYADVLLMHSELTGTADKMNLVRARAGLGNTSYTWQNIKDERHYEFAGEGLRFNDLRRWSGKNGGESCEAAKALQTKDGAKINYCGDWTTMHHASCSWAKRYADTDGFLAIPPQQIRIVADEDVLKQNAGWESANAEANLASCPAF